MTLGHPFPASPRWSWLRYRWNRTALLNFDLPFDLIAARCRFAQVYLATPYTLLAKDGAGEWSTHGSDAAAKHAALWARRLALRSVASASPIIQSVAMINADSLGHLDPLNEAFWSGYCQPILAASWAVIVPPIDGWSRSLGVWREVCYALERNKPVFVIQEEGRVSSYEG